MSDTPEPSGAGPDDPDRGGPGSPHGITTVTIEDEMKRSYLDYAMSVIVSRALPDVRDGLKPVHRRILYAMKELGYDWNRPYRKSARMVGDVMGKYHPHGDSAIYDAMVRMAQDFSMRLPLIDPQGNFGSMDGDPPAAMRYTEARLARVASDGLLEDIDRETVDFIDNYDETTTEPTVLPARFPNLLVNGAGGIAVGMATNIPPHNLGEVLDGCLALIDNPETSIEDLLEIVPGPDFPTGGIILGRSGIRAAYHTGRGSVVMRGRVNIEQRGKDRETIVVTEIPYQVNKARMLERIAEVVRDKTVEGIGDLRDESDRHGVRVVVELKREAMTDVVLNQLYRYTPLQTSFGVNMLAINGGRPLMMTLRDVLVAFLEFREEVITRRTIYDLGKARERAHVLVGLATAVANIDQVIALIRAAPDPVSAREQLMARDWPAGDVKPLVDLIDEPGHRVSEDGTYRLSEAQAKAILELRLQRLTGLEREKIAEELGELAGKIKGYLQILSSRERLLEVLRGEITAIREAYATPRRTDIEESEFEHDVEDLIPREDMVVTVTHGGYIKRVPLSTYRSQRRGGKGRSGMATREEDFVSRVFVCDTHTPVLFFSSRGMVYKMKVYRLPVGTPQARGKALVNLLPLDAGETITAFMPLPEDESAWDEMYVMFATTAGTVRRNKLSDFTEVKSNGKIAMKLEDGASLVDVFTCTDNDDVLLATARGKAIRFPVGDVRVFAGRNSFGVRGVRLAKGDEVISMSVLRHVEATPEEREAYLRAANAKRRLERDSYSKDEDRQRDQEAAEAFADPKMAERAANEEFILSITSDGLGKRTSAYEYRISGRGGQGIGNIDLSRAGKAKPLVVAAFPVATKDQLMLVTNAGQMIRCPIEGISILGRASRGVKVFDVDAEEHIVSVAHLSDLDEEDDEADADSEAEAAAESEDEAQDGAEDA
ncbi:MAG: DNA gyrase subunit A [Rhodovibrionaceae bacterium]